MLIIRAAIEQDINAFKQVIEISISRFCRTCYVDEQIKALLDQYPSTNVYKKWLVERVLRVAVLNNNVVGFAQYNPILASIEAINVDPEHSRRGVGKSLVRAIEVEAKQRRAKRITLDASLNAVDFYRACGYQEMGRGSYQCKNNIRLPTVRFEKCLD